MNLKDIFVNIKAKFDDKEVKKGTGSVDGLSKALAGLAAAYTIAKGVGFINNMAKQVDQLEKQARAVKLSTVELQAFKFAAGLSGVEGNSFVRVLGMVQKKATDMSQGLEQATKNFGLVGLEMKDITDSSGAMLGVEEMFLKIADGFSKLEATAQTGAAMKIFGEQGQALVPMLSEGRAGIEAMMNEAKQLGFVFDENAAKAAANFRDANTRLEGSLISLKNVIVVPLMKGMTDIILKISGFVTQVRDAFAGVDLFHVALMGLATISIPVLIGALNLLLKHPWVAAIMAGILMVDDLTVSFKGGQSAVREFFLEFKSHDINKNIDKITESVEWLIKALGRLAEFGSGALAMFIGGARAFGGDTKEKAALLGKDFENPDLTTDAGWERIKKAFSSEGTDGGTALASKFRNYMDKNKEDRVANQLASLTVPEGADLSGVDFADLRSKRQRFVELQRDKTADPAAVQQAFWEAQDAAAGRTGSMNVTILNPNDAQQARIVRDAMSSDISQMASY